MTSRPDYRIAEKLDEEDPLLPEEEKKALFEYTKARLNPKELWSDWSGSVGRFSSNITPEAGEGGVGAKLNEDINALANAVWDEMPEEDKNTIKNAGEQLTHHWNSAGNLDYKGDNILLKGADVGGVVAQKSLGALGKFWEMGHGLRSGLLQAAGVDKGLADKIASINQMFSGRAFPKVPRKIPFVSTTTTPAKNLLSSAVSDVSKGRNLLNITDQAELLNKLNTKALTTETSSFLRKGSLFRGSGGSGAEYIKQSKALARAFAGETPTGKEMYAFLATAPVTSNSSLLKDASRVGASRFRTDGDKNILKGTSIARTKIARENIGNKEFLQQLEDKTDEITAFARKNNNSLDGYPGIRTIKLPDGRVFRLEPSGKTGSGKFSWKSMDAADAATTKRAQSIVLDEKTLLKQLGSQELVTSYKEMNTTVVKKVKNAITEYNKGLPKSQQISLEHVFDVQHYGRLGEKVKRFSGQGADELGNLTILIGAGEGGNYATGAIARHIDSGDALIDLIRQNKFVDYTKTADDFLSFKLADTVKGFDAQDWKRFTDMVIANPETNIHELLINFN